MMCFSTLDSGVVKGMERFVKGTAGRGKGLGDTAPGQMYEANEAATSNVGINALI